MIKGSRHTEKTCEKLRLASARRGKPGTMLGRHHTEEELTKMRGREVSDGTREKLREAHKGQGLGRHLSDKTREKMRGRPGYIRTEEIREKTRLNHRGGAKRALYNNTWFRSGWEAKYAEYLDTWNIKWEYEPHTFVLEIEGKKTSYTPDFYLPEFNLYHEIKGWTRPGLDNVRKVQPAREQCEINLTVLDGVLLKRMGVL